MTDWISIDHWTTPKGRPIAGKLPDGQVRMVQFNPIAQVWQDLHCRNVPRPLQWQELPAIEARRKA